MTSYLRVNAYDHLVTVQDICDGQDQTLEFIVGHKKLKNGSWNTTNCQGNFQDASESITNFTMTTKSTCELMYGDDYVIKIRAVGLPLELPIHYLVYKVVHNLHKNYYNYLYMTHYFYRFDSFYPNVAEFFRKLMTSAGERRHMITNYVQQKLVTQHHIDGAYPPDYSCSVRSTYELTTGVMSTTSVTSIETAMKSAFEMETGVINKLSRVVLLATDDEELVEFVTSDLMKEMLKEMKIIESHHATIKALMTSSVNTKLAEFLFDKQNF